MSLVLELLSLIYISIHTSMHTFIHTSLIHRWFVYDNELCIDLRDLT